MQGRSTKVILSHSFVILFFSLIFYSIFHTVGYYPHQSAAQTTRKNDFTVYQNPTEKIQIEYPSNWTKAENLDADNVVAFRPPPDTYGKYSGVLGIYIHKLQVPTIPLDSYSKLQISSLKDQSFTIIKSYNTTLARQPGANVTYTNNKGLQALEVWTIKDGKSYVIMYIAGGTGKYNLHLPTIRSMIHSFEIQGNSTKRLA